MKIGNYNWKERNLAKVLIPVRIRIGLYDAAKNTKIYLRFFMYYLNSDMRIFYNGIW